MQINELSYRLFIGKDEQPWEENGASIREFTIFHRYEYAVPVLDIVLEDSANRIGNTIHINDGDPIKLEWGFGEHQFTYNFRVAKMQQSADNNTYNYKILAWEDRIKWFVDGNTKSYSGTSSEVLEKIAEECGLKFDGDKTTDKMTWLGNADRTHVFAKKIAKRGFAGDDSLMAVHCSHGVLRYKDLNAIDTNKPLIVFVQGQGVIRSIQVAGNQSIAFPITSYKLINKGGVFNLINGYKAVNEDQGIEKDGTKTENAPVRQRSGETSHNTDVSDQITTPRIDTGEIKTDNTHDNYNKAKYQNKRGGQLLRNAVIELTTNHLTNLAVFDPIWARVSSVNAGVTGYTENKNGAYDGPYIVYTRNVYVTGNTYAEKIIASREGIMK